MKPWTSVTYDPKEVHLSLCNTHRVDHELELGVIIGKTGKDIKIENAMDYVGGYFLGIDFSDRSIH